VRVPEITYGFTSGTDVAGVTFEILSRQLSASQSTNPIVFLLNDIPKGRILVLTNVALTGQPGATQLVDEMRIQAVTQAGLIYDIKTDVLVHAADEEVSLNWDGEIYIQGAGDGNTSLRAIVTYDSGTNANTSTVGWAGIIIPHGNVGAF